MKDHDQQQGRDQGVDLAEVDFPQKVSSEDHGGGQGDEKRPFPDGPEKPDGQVKHEDRRDDHDGVPNGLGRVQRDERERKIKER